MTTSTSINCPISVTAIGFDRGMQVFPRRIEFEGVTYKFAGSGRSAVIRSNERVVQFFSMTDGIRSFHLRSDGKSWILLSMT